MKNICKKISSVLGWIYGSGIAISLFLGGLSFLVYIVAFCIGGQTATDICVFVYKKFYPWLFIFSSAIVLVGLLKMYLNGEVAFSIKKKSKTVKDKPATEPVENNLEQTAVGTESVNEEQTENTESNNKKE